MDNKKEVLKKFGSQLRRIRESKGISAAELGRLTFMERSHIARLEAGGTNPTLTTLIRISESLDIELIELFEGYFYKKSKK